MHILLVSCRLTSDDCISEPFSDRTDKCECTENVSENNLEFQEDISENEEQNFQVHFNVNR